MNTVVFERPRVAETHGIIEYGTPMPLRVLGKRWALSIMKELHGDPYERLGFMELRRRLTNISPKVLSQRLKEMEAVDLLKRKEKNHTLPKRVQYSLTERGVTAYKIARKLAATS